MNNKKKFLVILVMASFLSAGTIYGFYKLTSPEIVNLVSAVERDYPSVETLYDSSEVIARGKVIDKEVKSHTYTDDEGEERVHYYTEKQYRVQKVYKGQKIKSGETIIVRTQDAKTDKVVQIAGANIDKNNNYVLFLKTSVFPKETGAYTFVGGPQGIFTLEAKELHHKYKGIKDLQQLEKKLTQLRNNER